MEDSMYLSTIELNLNHSNQGHTYSNDSWLGKWNMKLDDESQSKKQMEHESQSKNNRGEIQRKIRLEISVIHRSENFDFPSLKKTSIFEMFANNSIMDNNWAEADKNTMIAIGILLEWLGTRIIWNN